MIADDTENKMGEILFQMVAQAMRDVNANMEVTAYSQLSPAQQENYRGVARRLAEAMDADSLPEAKESEVVAAITEEPSPLLDAIRGEGDGELALAPSPPEKNPIECDECGKVCKSEFGLMSHKRSHKTILEKVPA